MNSRLVLPVLALGVAAFAGAQSTSQGAEQSGLQAMQYYVGSWTCVGGAPGKSTKGTIQYRIDAGALRDDVAAAMVQGKMARVWLTTETKWDPSLHVFVNTIFDNGGWDVSYAKPWSGNTEEWSDHSTADGKLGHDRVVRVSNVEFVHTAFTTLTGTQQAYKVTCTRAK